ncbi:hypothetical protein [Actinophytocola glycyrrhizae]|uniref:Uncharacterized protein n=1 Tax=Actinophytocola glycyrrhizae TaxID=2044873 RepID=A0ABV9S5B1_9PSEU
MARTRRVPGRLSTLSEYELRHLGRHLAASGNSRDLRLLLHLDTEDGRNAWFEAKQAVDDLDGYHGDVGAAWQLADAGGTAGDHVDYALIAASVTGMARELPADLLATTVAYGVVSSYAVESVRRVPVAARQADMICAVAPHLSGEHRLPLLEVARGIAPGPVRARALAALAPYVPAQLTAAVVAEVLADPPSGG